MTQRTTNAQILSAVSEVKSELAGLSVETKNLSGKVTKLTEKSEETRRTLRGHNDSPGLVARMASIDEKVEGIGEIKKTLSGTGNNPGLVERVRGLEVLQENVDILSGTDKNPGLVERVRGLEILQKNIRYWLFFIAGAIIIGLINSIGKYIPIILNTGP